MGMPLFDAKKQVWVTKNKPLLYEASLSQTAFIRKIKTKLIRTKNKKIHGIDLI